MFLRRFLAVVAVATVALATAACDTIIDDQPPGQTERAHTTLPATATEIIPAAPAADLAIATSRALFTRAPVVVLASDGSVAGQRAAAGTAAQAGAPLLLVPSDGEPTAGLGSAGGPAQPAPTPGRDADTDAAGADPGTPAGTGGATTALRQELARLGVVTLVPYDDPAVRWAQAAVADWPDSPAGDPVDPAAAPAATAPAVPGGAGQAPLPVAGPPRLVAPGDELPRAELAEPLASLLVLISDTDGRDRTFAAAVTARAAGARVLAMTGPDPRGDPAAVEALAAAPPDRVLAIGDRFGSPEQLRRRLAVAATGVQLPGGGQLVFPGRRMVALYGHPGTPVLGVLGEQPVDAAVARALEVAGEYASLVDEPVVPVFEIITTVASGAPGPEGDYSLRTPVDTLRPWVAAAAQAGIYVVLDLQPGRTDFLSQAVLYQELLTEPHVGLALDPEWRLAPGQVHLEQIGTVGAAEVNEVADWLAALTREHQLPQKLLVLHQFRLDMITERSTLRTGHDELSILIHADGHGTPGQKFDTWRTLRADAPDGLWWGWKNFYDEDQPMFTPAETVEVEPSPRFISYQ